VVQSRLIDAAAIRARTVIFATVLHHLSLVSSLGGSVGACICWLEGGKGGTFPSVLLRWETCVVSSAEVRVGRALFICVLSSLS
jgi:hypothetical protein